MTEDEFKQKWSTPQYIGDGVYAHYDGRQIWLRTQRESGWHEIALEPQVFAGLEQYQSALNNDIESMRDKND